MDRLVRSKVDVESISIESLAMVVQHLSYRDVPVKGILDVYDYQGMKGLLGNFLKTSKTFMQAAYLFLQKGGGWKPKSGFMTPRLRITLGIEEPVMPIRFVVIDYGTRLKERMGARIGHQAPPHRIIRLGEADDKGTVSHLLNLWSQETNIELEWIATSTLSVSSAQGIQSLQTGVSAECFEFILSMEQVCQENIGFITMEVSLPTVDLTADTPDAVDVTRV